MINIHKTKNFRGPLAAGMAKVGLSWRALQTGRQSASLTYFYTLMRWQSQGKSAENQRDPANAPFRGRLRGSGARCPERGEEYDCAETKSAENVEENRSDCTILKKVAG